MSTHWNMFRFTSGGENSCVACQDSISPGQKWQAFYERFWRWRLYYSGSATSTQPSEDLAPHHLLVSQCIMSSTCVYVCVCVCVCVCVHVRISEATDKQRLRSYLKICLDWQLWWADTHLRSNGISVPRGFLYLIIAVGLVLFRLFKIGELCWNSENWTCKLNVKKFLHLSASALLWCLVPKHKPNEECFITSEACLWFQRVTDKKQRRGNCLLTWIVYWWPMNPSCIPPRQKKTPHHPKKSPASKKTWCNGLLHLCIAGLLEMTLRCKFLLIFSP